MIKINLKRASHASILLVGFMVAKSLLGLILKRSIAGYFGAGVETDAYFAAFTIPQQLGDFVIGGIIFKVVIPVFQERREVDGDDIAVRDVAGVLNFATLLLVVLTVGYLLLIPYIIPLLFSGFNTETMKLTISLARWLSPAIVLMGLSLIYVAFYHVHKSFLVPAISTLLFPISSLMALYILPSEWGIMRLVYGNLIGVSLGVLFLILFLKDKFHWSWSWSLANPALTATFMVAWPLLVANLIGKIIPFVQKNAASNLPYQGNVSLLEYAFFLSGTVLIFIASPITTAIFPLMGELKARGDEKELINTFHQSVKVVVFLALPCALFFAVESKDIVKILLQNGEFSEQDTQICANLITIISIMIVPQSINLIMNNMFLVHKKTKMMGVATSIITLLSIPIYYFFSAQYGIYGIALTYTGIYVIAPIVLFFLLVRINSDFLSKSFYKIAIIFLILFIMMGLSCAISKYLLMDFNIFLRIVVVFTISLAVYIFFGFVLGVDVLKIIVSKITRNKNGI